MTSISGAGGTSIYIRSDSGSVQYSTNNTSWLSLSFPAQITNSNTSQGYLTIEFTTNITLSGTAYFVCETPYIQFGKSTLNSDGSVPVITVQTSNYDGLILNGEENTAAKANIRVCNLRINGGGNTTQVGAGWFGKAWFGQGASNNVLVNCSVTNGSIGASGGGIVGRFAGYGASGSVTLRGCSTDGLIGSGAGGIAGSFSGQNGGSVTCDRCWSTGAIQGGGIFGASAGSGSSGSATAIRCYSTGSISSGSGGIFGAAAGTSSGSATAQNCYSTGNIQSAGGGIFGQNAGTLSGSPSAQNCYSIGTVVTSGTEIFGSNAQNATRTNCYGASGSWNTSSANAALTGIPTAPSKVGTAWVNTTNGQPYEINTMGFTPYTINIVDSNANLVRTFSFSVAKGNSTAAALVSGRSYSILQSDSETITIDSSTGALSTTSETPEGSYTVTIRNSGSYNISQVTLTVTSSESQTNWGLIWTLIAVGVLLWIYYF